MSTIRPSSNPIIGWGSVALDAAIGKQVTLHDWYGPITGRLDSWEARTPMSVRVELTLLDGRQAGFTLMATHEITVED